ncbi:MAG TPA: YciI family protein [Candidatus Dormibacteraeota bacterium]|nr:YciI family protein [Candidatus Dormibacteraeota bacterium]
MRLDAYTVVFLRRPPDAPQLSDEELDALQAEHLAFNDRMRGEGHALTTGPLTDQPDVSLRGISVFRTSIEETRSLMERDASVRAGRLAIEVCTWLVPAGTLGDRPAGTVEID